MQIKLLNWKNETDGDFSEHALINKLEQAGFSCTRFTYPPGTCFPDHEHDIDKMDAVVKGCFRISGEGRDYLLQPGDSVLVPAGTRHSAEVVGDEAVVAIDAIRTG